MLFTREQHQWYQHVLLMLFCFFIPIYQQLATGFILLLGVNWLLSGAFSEKFQNFLRPLPLLFSALYFIHILGLFYTDYISVACHNVETKLSLFIFPLILFSAPPKKTKEIKQLLYSFILACFIGSVLCLLKAGMLYADTGKNAFHYEFLSGQLDFHPSYYACYMTFSLFLLLFFLADSWHKLKNFQRYSGILLSGYFLLFILVLSARMEILASFILFPISFLVFMIKRKQLMMGLLIMLVALVTVSSIAWLLPSTKMRIQTALNGLFYSDQSNTAPDIRLQIWGSSIDVIKEKIIFGQGTAGALPKMLVQYEMKNYTIAKEKELNIHNQYLETTVALGLLGLIILLGNFLIPFFLAWRKKQFIYLFFLALFALAILTENMLERQQGVIFYAFFNSLLACWMLSEEEVSS